ncbi:MAG: TIGR00266 family protein [Planctomycetota bacterium]|nr:TIGR00266 family protein [Planctomycetota bacterium]
MDVQVLGNPDYGELKVDLGAGETILIEGGAMSRMTTSMDMRSRIMGGILSGLMRKVFGGESLFVGEYGGASGGELALSPSLPGTVCHRRLDGDELFLTAGSFLACTPGVTLKTRFGGFRALFSGEGAFLLRALGTGDLWFNAYGAVMERDLDGELTVDTGHVVGWEPGIEYSIGGMGGLKSTLFSGEGLTMKFRGQGKIWLQSRNLPATAGWLSPFCVG